MRRATLLAGLLLIAGASLFVQLPIPAAACSPVVNIGGTPAPDPYRTIIILPTATLSTTEIASAFTNVDAVFVGHVESVVSGNGDNNTVQRATLAVTKVWKGRIAPRVDIAIPRVLPSDTPTAYTDCDVLVYPDGNGGTPKGYFFAPNNDYLVFARARVGGFDALPGTGPVAAMTSTIATFGSGYGPSIAVIKPQSQTHTIILIGLIVIAFVGSFIALRTRRRKY